MTYLWKICENTVSIYALITSIRQKNLRTADHLGLSKVRMSGKSRNWKIVGGSGRQVLWISLPLGKPDIQPSPVSLEIETTWIVFPHSRSKWECNAIYIIKPTHRALIGCGDSHDSLMISGRRTAAWLAADEVGINVMHPFYKTLQLTEDPRQLWSCLWCQLIMFIANNMTDHLLYVFLWSTLNFRRYSKCNHQVLLCQLMVPSKKRPSKTPCCLLQKEITFC